VRATCPARRPRLPYLVCAAQLLLLNGCLSGPPTPVPGPPTLAPPAPTAPAVFTPPAAGQVLIGTWGSGEIHVTANRFGAAMAFHCAEGRFEQPLQVDAQGRFAVLGTFFWMPGNPQLTPPALRPAHYEGQIIGSTMVLTMTFLAPEPVTDIYHLPLVSAEPTYVPPSPCEEGRASRVILASSGVRPPT
jgi:hypothetical protein